MYLWSLLKLKIWFCGPVCVCTTVCHRTCMKTKAESSLYLCRQGIVKASCSCFRVTAVPRNLQGFQHSLLFCRRADLYDPYRQYVWSKACKLWFLLLKFDCGPSTKISSFGGFIYFYSNFFLSSDAAAVYSACVNRNLVCCCPVCFFHYGVHVAVLQNCTCTSCCYTGLEPFLKPLCRCKQQEAVSQVPSKCFEQPKGASCKGIFFLLHMFSVLD